MQEVSLVGFPDSFIQQMFSQESHRGVRVERRRRTRRPRVDSSLLLRKELEDVPPHEVSGFRRRDRLRFLADALEAINVNVVQS